MGRALDRPDPRTQGDAGDVDTIRRYYRETAWQYRLVWSREHMHYGYWDGGVRSHEASLTRMLEVMADEGRVRLPGTRVLDAGCGVGGSARWLAGTRKARVMGISIVPEQVAQANRRTRKQGVRGARFLCADYRDVPVADGGCEVVWALESSCYARPKVDLLREAYRVLEPGGRLVVADFYRTGKATPDQERALADWEGDWAMPRLQTPDEWHDDLLRAGYSLVRSRDITQHVLPSARRLRNLGRLFVPLARLASLWSPQVPIRNILSADRQWRALAGGAASYWITVAVRDPLDRLKA